MTKQESFKKRIRARMQKTGEKYNAARRALIERAEHRRADAAADHRAWVAEPEHSEEAVRAATERGWDEWVDLIEHGPAAAEGHTAVAAWLQAEHDLDGWWAQSVTGGWERITGRRLPYQRPDGTFTASKSRTMAGLEADRIRTMLLEPEGRAALFPTQLTELRSRPGSRLVRIALEEGVAVIGLVEQDDGRVQVGIQHEKLPRFDDVELWKQFWDDWLDALAEQV